MRLYGLNWSCVVPPQGKDGSLSKLYHATLFCIGRKTEKMESVEGLPVTSMTTAVEGNVSRGAGKRAAAWRSILAALFLTGLKLVIGLGTGSLGILSEAANSG